MDPPVNSDQNAGAHHGVLWSLGSRLIDARLHDADATIAAAIDDVMGYLDADFVAVSRVENGTLRSSREYGWARDPDNDPGDNARLRISPGFAERFLAAGGTATGTLAEILGEETVEARGWPQGTAVVSMIERTDDVTRVLVVAAVRSAWDEAEIDLLRTFATLLRQFIVRIRVESQLDYRLRLEDLVGRTTEMLMEATADDCEDLIDTVLRDLHEVLGLSASVLVDLLDESTVEISHEGGTDIREEFRRFGVPDLSMLDIAGDPTSVREFLSELRVFDVAEIVEALAGADVARSMRLFEEPRVVALVPASVTSAKTAVIAAARTGTDVEWLAEELEAITTVASTIAQTRARVAAELDSSFRLGVQQALAETAADFLTVDADGAADAVTRAIERMGAQLDADFAVLASVDLDGDRFVMERAWGREIGEIDPQGSVFHDPDHDWIGPVAEGRVVAGVVGPDSSAALVNAEMVSSTWSFVSAPVRDDADDLVSLGFVWSHGHPGEESTICDLVLSVADLIGQLRSRLAAQREVARRLELDEVLSTTADEFLGAAASDHDEVVRRALERVSDHLGLAGATITRIEGDVSVVEVAHAPMGRLEQGKEADVSASDVPDRIRRGEWIQLLHVPDEWADWLEKRWGFAGTLVTGPVAVGSEVRAALSGMRRDDAEWSVVELDAFRSFAAMLGQLRARVEAERQGERQLSAQRVLGECAVELAEARAEDLTPRLAAVLRRVGEFLDIDSLVSWRVDGVAERYVAVVDWSNGAEPFHPGVEYAWGNGGVLDEVRDQDRRRVTEIDDSARHRVARAAFPRGEGGTDAVLVASSRATGPWRADTIELLEALSRTIHQVESRIAAELYAETAFSAAPIGVVLRDHLLRLVTCNQAFADFLGAESIEELIGTMPGDVYDDSYESIEWEDRDGNLSAEGAFRRRNGGRVWGQMRGSVIETGPHAEPMWLVHVEDVTERRRAEQLLRFQASHDELTGLANRRELLDEVRRISAGSGSVAILLLDLDRFKLINDSLGHDRGDEMLVAVADRLRLAVRPGDLVARLGGDEFAVVLPGPVTVSEAEFVADRLLGLIGEPVNLGSQEVFPRASIGIAVADEGVPVSELLRRADTAMYRAKAKGRARHEAFDEELRHEVITRMATEAGLRGALRGDELTVHYQPEVSLVTGDVLAVEALVRWDHPERGMLAAGEFIEIAEETGLVVEIGARVLEQACAEAVRWPGGPASPLLRVNLSASQIQRDETIALVRSTLDTIGLPPDRLCLEITESAVMADLDRSGETLDRLKELGVKLAVDDFGTGFSSLAYLKLFPVDLLKIDRAFVDGLPGDADDTAVVRSIISLAEALDLEVVAEGVETEEQAAALLELGCARAQGYLFARPMPGPELLARFISN